MPDQSWLGYCALVDRLGSVEAVYPALEKELGYDDHLRQAVAGLEAAFDWLEFDPQSNEQDRITSIYLTPTTDEWDTVVIHFQRLLEPLIKIYPAQLPPTLLSTIARAHPLFAAMLPWVEPARGALHPENV